MKRMILVILACAIASCASKEKEMGREPNQVTGGVSKAESMALSAQEPQEETGKERRERRRAEKQAEADEYRAGNLWRKIQEDCKGPLGQDEKFTFKVLNGIIFRVMVSHGVRIRDIKTKEEQALQETLRITYAVPSLRFVNPLNGDTKRRPICDYSLHQLALFAEESIPPGGNSANINSFYSRLRKMDYNQGLDFE